MALDKELIFAPPYCCMKQSFVKAYEYPFWNSEW